MSQGSARSVRLIALRTQRGLTATEVASGADVGHADLIMLEAGAAPTDATPLHRLADFFGVPVVTFFLDAQWLTVAQIAQWLQLRPKRARGPRRKHTDLSDGSLEVAL